jgi:hypothetical protein
MVVLLVGSDEAALQATIATQMRAQGWNASKELLYWQHHCGYRASGGMVHPTGKEPGSDPKGLTPVSAVGSKTADCKQTHNTPQTPKNLIIILFAVEK